MRILCYILILHILYFFKLLNINNNILKLIPITMKGLILSVCLLAALLIPEFNHISAKKHVQRFKIDTIDTTTSPDNK